METMVEHLVQNLSDLNLQQWQRLVDILQKLITIVAILAGGLWAYFNFSKTRTLRGRLDLDVKSTIASSDVSGTHLIVTTTLTNKGQTHVRLGRKGSGLMVSVLDPPTVGSRDIQVLSNAQRVVTVEDVFESHRWIEPGETVADQPIVFVPRARAQAEYALELQLRVVHKRLVRSNIEWVARDTVLLEDANRARKAAGHEAS